jgi:hypothetical protein
MSFSIDVSGLDELEKDIEAMLKGLRLETLQHWAGEIEAKARELASTRVPMDVRDSIRLEVLEPKPKTFEVKAHAQQEGIAFIVEATKSILPNMPVTSQTIFEALLDELEKSPALKGANNR